MCLVIRLLCSTNRRIPQILTVTNWFCLQKKHFSLSKTTRNVIGRSQLQLQETLSGPETEIKRITLSVWLKLLCRAGNGSKRQKQDIPCPYKVRKIGYRKSRVVNIYLVGKTKFICLYHAKVFRKLLVILKKIQLGINAHAVSMSQHPLTSPQTHFFLKCFVTFHFASMTFFFFKNLSISRKIQTGQSWSG